MYNAVRLVRVLVGFHGANSAKCEEATHVLPTKVISYFRIYTEVPKGRAVGTKVRKYFRTKVLPYENINTKVLSYESTEVLSYFRTKVLPYGYFRTRTRTFVYRAPDTHQPHRESCGRTRYRSRSFRRAFLRAGS